jgi:hypothetical protein
VLPSSATQLEATIKSAFVGMFARASNAAEICGSKFADIPKDPLSLAMVLYCKS